MLQVHFIRHGETDYNLNHIVQGGGVDSNLNHTGRTQANRFYKQYKEVPFDAVIASGLQRTHETLYPFIFRGGYELVQYPEFNELNWGELEGVAGSPEIRAKYMELNEAWDAGRLDVRVPGGESPEMGWKRSRMGIERLLKEYPSGSRILVCTHGRILRIMLSQILGYGMHRMNWFPHQNTALNALRIYPNMKSIALKLNDQTHLQG